MFTWIPIHREAIQRTLEHRHNQQELLTILREMEQQGLTVISLEDEGPDGQTLPLEEIDPFTFLASFNRGVADENRRKNWSYLKERWGLKSGVPDDFTGIPTLNNMRSWLMPWARDRQKDHVERLWQIASLAAHGSIEQVGAEVFDSCLKLPQVRMANLTIGLFWINPEKFLPADHKTTAYGKFKGVTTEPEDYRSYRQWLSEMTERLGSEYPRISHDAHLFATQSQTKLDLTPARMQTLWDRFHTVIKGFTDFPNPGEDFVKNETAYKRAILKKFQQQLGAEKLSSLVAQGQGLKAAKEIVRVLNSNLVSFHSWNPTLGETDSAACDVVRECLKATAAPYHGPESTSDLFDACARHNLKPAWDALTVLLWALRSQDFFPVKISFYRKLSAELGHELPSGPPDADKLHRLIEFGRAFWQALEPKKPSDWVDVQSFIWCVCPGNHEGGAEPKPVVVAPSPSPGVAYWWLNANPKIWNFEETPVGEKQTYTSHNEKGNKRQKSRYFQEAKPGDLVIGCVTSPQKEVVAVCKITKGLHQTENGEEIEFEKVEQLAKPIAYETLQANPDLANSEPLINNQGSLFKLTEPEYEIIRSLIDETNIAVPTKIESYDKKQAMKGLFLAESQFD